MDIEGKVAVVTGAGSGLGRAAAIILAERGARLALVDRSEIALASVASETGGHGYTCDVSSDEAVEAVFRRVLDDLGTPLILVNCAGILGSFRTITKHTEPASLEDFRKVIDINLFGTFNMMRLFAQSIADTLGESDEDVGVIINTSSIAAEEGLSGQAGYSASKGGVWGLTLPAARELGKFGIRVMAIAPGVFQTGLAEDIKQKTLDSLRADNILPRRLGNPEEFGRLCCDIIENPMANGTVWRLDAAARMREPRY